MAMFNNFLSNNNAKNTSKSVNKKVVVDMTLYLTNDERLELKKDLNNGKNINTKMSAMVKRKVNSVNMNALKISPLKLGFFNAIVNENFDKKERVDLVNIFNKKPHAKKSVPNTSLDIEIRSIKLYYGQFKVGAEHSLSGVFGEVDPKKKYFMVQLSAHVYDGKEHQGITFRVYRNGKIHFSGGILNNNIKQPEQIRRYIVDNFTNRENFLYSPISYNNTAGQFDVNGALNLPGIASALRISAKISYEPELRAALRMDYLGSSFQMFTTGIVQILGVRNEKDMLRAYENGKSIVTQLYVMGLLKLSNAPVKVKKAKKIELNATNTVSSAYQKLQSVGKANAVTMKNACAEIKKKGTAPNNTVTYNDKKNVLKIGRKICTRYPKSQLMAAAKRIGVVDLKATTTKAKICEKINERVFGSFRVDKKPCLRYTKAQLTPLAIAKGVNVTNADTVKTICEKMAKPKTKTTIPQAKVTAVNPEIMKKRRLTNETIRENLETLYGKKWINTYKNVMPSLNENVAEIKRRVEAFNIRKNKKGVPFKMNVNAIKKTSVRDWKLFRRQKLDNELKKQNNKFTSELNNLLKEVGNVLQKRSPKKKFPKGTIVEEL